ncbi:MAG: response regulator transcription factor [Chloroflexi bacterium]|nr:response regulator transcription factor [Chloroflexota bacterium]
MTDHLRILAIEDDPDLGYLYDSFLTEEGHQVTIARNGREAVKALGTKQDVVLLDLMLPGTDGYSLLRRIRADPSMRTLPVVVISAAIPPGRQRILGADAVVHKPFEFEDLTRVIQGVSHHAHAA